MDDMKEVKRQARKLLWAGFLVGLIVGAMGGFLIADHFIERVIVVPMGEGINT